ncbi:hypothetical membrane protein [Bacillus sp. OxB-1]|uniref:DUF418 domain-containing protein n=1 Tax=Bacillus sp. (strain OxB-1) TaxID=98228 RepID=UPI00058202C8|nr:DUF418 domain-containing protein [Bacillus sp. OxB-1]BAQ08606.1 hypothetical membrane protein [Bacillus sp. OxB-1]
MKRIEVLDGLRGFALLGILIVNINFFNESLMAISLGGLPVAGGVNDTIKTISALFVEGKFLSLFSFLFGYGAVILYSNAEANGRKFTPMFIRRMLALLFFGVLHGIFIWHGDILTSYALMGLFLLPFMRRSPKTTLIWSIALTLLIPVIMALFMVVGSLTEVENTKNMYTIDPSQIMAFQQEDQRIYGEGTYMEMTVKRMNDYISSLLNMILFFPQILGIFLLGAYFAKRKLFEDMYSKKDTFVKLGWIGGIAGIASTIPRMLVDSSNSLLDIGSVFIGAPLLMLSYVSIFSIVFMKRPKYLHFFTYPGKMAFSMYILQSVICSLVFYSYGLGLFGKLTLWQTTAIALLIFGLQSVIGKIWLHRFRTGPLEYVWRILYKGKHALRREAY